MQTFLGPKKSVLKVLVTSIALGQKDETNCFVVLLVTVHRLSLPEHKGVFIVLSYKRTLP